MGEQKKHGTLIPVKVCKMPTLNRMPNLDIPKVDNRQSPNFDCNISPKSEFGLNIMK